MVTFTVLYSIFFTHSSICRTKANAHTHIYIYMHTQLLRERQTMTNLVVQQICSLFATWNCSIYINQRTRASIHSIVHLRWICCLRTPMHTGTHWGINRIWEFHIAVNFKINGVNQQITTIIIPQIYGRRIFCAVQEKNIECYDYTYNICRWLKFWWSKQNWSYLFWAIPWTLQLWAHRISLVLWLLLLLLLLSRKHLPWIFGLRKISI